MRWEAPNSVDNWALSACGFCVFEANPSSLGCWWLIVGAVSLNFAYLSLVCSFSFSFVFFLVFFLNVF